MVLPDPITQIAGVEPTYSAREAAALLKRSYSWLDQRLRDPPLGGRQIRTFGIRPLHQQIAPRRPTALAQPIQEDPRYCEPTRRVPR